MSIEVEHITKTFRSQGGLFTALKDVSLSIQTGELVALLGPVARGRRPCCGSSRAWKRLTPTAGASVFIRRT